MGINVINLQKCLYDEETFVEGMKLFETMFPEEFKKVDKDKRKYNEMFNFIVGYKLGKKIGEKVG